MKIQHFLTVLITCIENLLSGLIFGWAFLVFVLKAEGYYSNLCDKTTQEYANNTSSNLTTIITTTAAIRIYPECPEQDEALALIFSVGICCIGLGMFISGIVFRKFGTWVTRGIAVACFTSGCIIFATSSNTMSNILFLGAGFISIGGVCYFVSNIQYINLAPNFKATLSSVYNGIYQTSAVMLWLVLLAHRNEINFRTMFFGFSSFSAFSLVITFFLTPVKFLPANKGNDFTYGIHNLLVKYYTKRFKTKGNISKPTTTISVIETLSNESRQTTDPTSEPICTGSNLNRRPSKENNNITPKESIPTVWYCIRTRFFLTTSIQCWCLHSRNVFFIGFFNSWVESLTDDAQRISSLTDTFAVFLLACGLTGILIGISIDKLILRFKNNGDLHEFATLKSLLIGAIIQSSIGLIFAVLVTIPNVNLQYFSLVVYSFFRGTLYTFSLICIRTRYHFKLTGALFGALNVVNGLLALLTRPLLGWVFNSFDGDFLYVNILLIAVTVLSYVHPLSLYFEYKKKLKLLILNPVVLSNEGAVDDVPT